VKYVQYKIILICY